MLLLISSCADVADAQLARFIYLYIYTGVIDITRVYVYTNYVVHIFIIFSAWGQNPYKITINCRIVLL